MRIRNIRFNIIFLELYEISTDQVECRSYIYIAINVSGLGLCFEVLNSLADLQIPRMLNNLSILCSNVQGSLDDP